MVARVTTSEACHRPAVRGGEKDGSVGRPGWPLTEGILSYTPMSTPPPRLGPWGGKPTAGRTFQEEVKEFIKAGSEHVINGALGDQWKMVTRKKWANGCLRTTKLTYFSESSFTLTSMPPVRFSGASKWVLQDADNPGRDSALPSSATGA